MAMVDGVGGARRVRIRCRYEDNGGQDQNKSGGGRSSYEPGRKVLS
jgi:hypothetical protein